MSNAIDAPMLDHVSVSVARCLGCHTVACLTESTRGKEKVPWRVSVSVTANASRGKPQAASSLLESTRTCTQQIHWGLQCATDGWIGAISVSLVMLAILEQQQNLLRERKVWHP